eukprot:TRINITY_DN17359_c0_g1_i1.p1 TRINITY_DN17359_c0_g1~~TRINITY_DN17359_c0_g1_i1.p1  ORF type:complete len:194 (-),score=34.67 TRINITY_DN17359_c0_g1_i1:155-709(-)
MPLSDFQKRKVEHLFNVEDINKNGVLQEDDYILIAKKQLAKSGISDESEQGQKYIQVYKDEWLRLSTEAKAEEGMVTLDKYTNYFENIIEKNDFSFFKNVVHTYIASGDTDGDGKLSLEEYAALLSAVGISEDQAKANFDQLDLNKDGYLDESEFLHHLQQFLTSDDPASVSNHFLGHQSLSFN